MDRRKPGRPPRYPLIAKDLMRRIDEGEFKPGERFFTQREVNRIYNASSRTTEQAWEMLRANGYITSIIGEGTYVKKRS